MDTPACAACAVLTLIELLLMARVERLGARPKPQPKARETSATHRRSR